MLYVKHWRDATVSLVTGYFSTSMCFWDSSNLYDCFFLLVKKHLFIFLFFMAEVPTRNSRNWLFLCEQFSDSNFFLTLLKGFYCNSELNIQPARFWSLLLHLTAHFDKVINSQHYCIRFSLSKEKKNIFK